MTVKYTHASYHSYKPVLLEKWPSLQVKKMSPSIPIYIELIAVSIIWVFFLWTQKLEYHYNMMALVLKFWQEKSPDFFRSINPLSTWVWDRLCPQNFCSPPKIFRPSDVPGLMFNGFEKLSAFLDKNQKLDLVQCTLRS